MSYLEPDFVKSLLCTSFPELPLQLEINNNGPAYTSKRFEGFYNLQTINIVTKSLTIQGSSYCEATPLRT